MHSSLKPKNNLRLIVGWAAVGVFIGILYSNSMVWMFFAAGAMLGAIGGFLQLRALQESSDLFIAAEGSMAVRRALTASPWGRAYIAVFWISSITMLALAILLLHGGMIFGWLAWFSAHSLVRELVTLRETHKLERLSISE